MSVNTSQNQPTTGDVVTSSVRVTEEDDSNILEEDLHK